MRSPTRQQKPQPILRLHQGGYRRLAAAIAAAAIAVCCSGPVISIGDGGSKGLTGQVFALQRDGKIDRPLEGATVRIGKIERVTDIAGFWSLTDEEVQSQTGWKPGSTAEAPMPIRFAMPGYGTYTQVMDGGRLGGMFVRTVLMPVTAARTVTVAEGAVITVNPEDAAGYTEAVVVLPPGFAELGTSTVDVSVSLIRPRVPTELALFPGLFVGRTGKSGSVTDLIRTFGTMGVEFAAAGVPISGVTLTHPAIMQMKLDDTFSAEFAAPQTIDTWSLDETTGQWVREGQARVVGIDGQRYAEWKADHFTWWNLDKALADHACIAVHLEDLTADDRAAMGRIDLILEGDDFGFRTTGQFNADDVAAVTGWRGHLARLSLQFAGASAGSFSWQIAPETADEGSIATGAFRIPTTFGSTKFGRGPDGPPLVPQEHCLYLNRKPPKQGVVEGYVRDPDGEPVAGATVFIDKLGLSAQSNPEGHFTIPHVPWSFDGKIVISVSARPPDTRPDIEFETVEVLRNQAHHRIEIPSTSRSMKPRIAFKSIDATEAPLGATVKIAVHVVDDNPGLQWSIVAGAGQVVPATPVTKQAASGGYASDLKIDWGGITQPGAAELTVTAIDAGKKHVSTSFRVTWRDRPAIVSLDAPTYADIGAPVTATVAAIDPAGLPLTFVWRHNGIQIAAPATATTVGLTASRGGPNVISLSVANRAASTTVQHTYYAGVVPHDGPGPETYLVNKPSDFSNSATVTLAFGAIGANIARLECSFDAAAFAECVSPATVSNLADGAHRFEVRAVDEEGIADPTPALAEWVVDRIPPGDTFILSAPPPLTSSTRAYFAFGSTETDPESVHYVCALDDDPVRWCHREMIVPDASPGTHRLSVQAADAAGNVDPSPAETTWTVVFGAPSDIQTGPGRACATMADGTAKCWGLDLSALRAQMTFIGQSSSVYMEHVTALSYGVFDFLGYITGGFVTPVDVPEFPGPIVQMALGQSHTCALRTDGAVFCGGYNTFGQIGDGSTLMPVATKRVGLAATVVEIAVTDTFSCARTDIGDVYCWGDFGPDGVGIADSLLPVAIPLPGVASQIVTGIDHACALVAGAAVCWGGNGVRLIYQETGGYGECFGGQIGQGSCGTVATPAYASGLTDAVALSAGPYFSCAIRASGALTCWGEAGFGIWQRSVLHTTPTPVIGIGMGSGLSEINGRCVKFADDTMQCWEAGSDPQPVTEATGPSPFVRFDREDVPGGGPNCINDQIFGTAWCFRSAACALDAAGSIWCWGDNGGGQLGNGTTVDSAKPVRVTGF